MLTETLNAEKNLRPRLSSVIFIVATLIAEALFKQLLIHTAV